jgi:hypothetical protein
MCELTRHGMVGARHGMCEMTRHGMAGARHGMCELPRHGMAGERHDMCELTRHGVAGERHGMCELALSDSGSTSVICSQLHFTISPYSSFFRHRRNDFSSSERRETTLSSWYWHLKSVAFEVVTSFLNTWKDDTEFQSTKY